MNIKTILREAIFLFAVTISINYFLAGIVFYGEENNFTNLFYERFDIAFTMAVISYLMIFFYLACFKSIDIVKEFKLISYDLKYHFVFISSLCHFGFLYMFIEGYDLGENKIYAIITMLLLDALIVVDMYIERSKEEEINI
ncbi:hypothetical protein [Vibrio bivalvicida]|uniref:Uncharacterized protein n=1 Tax=Vibrio bivalvicida TaxID=1276888 RepID=A0ABV4MQG2_9VIBR